MKNLTLVYLRVGRQVCAFYFSTYFLITIYAECVNKHGWPIPTSNAVIILHLVIIVQLCCYYYVLNL